MPGELNSKDLDSSFSNLKIYQEEPLDESEDRVGELDLLDMIRLEQSNTLSLKDVK